MDNPVNENVIEKVKFRDILAILKSIVVGKKSTENEKVIDEELQKVYEVEKALGATDSIAKLTKEIETHDTLKKRKTTGNSEKGLQNNNSVKENINSRNNKEKQEEKEKEIE